MFAGYLSGPNFITEGISSNSTSFVIDSFIVETNPLTDQNALLYIATLCFNLCFHFSLQNPYKKEDACLVR